MNIVQLMTEVMARARAAAEGQQDEARKTKFHEVEAAFSKLETAVNDAKADDRSEALDIWTEWARLWKHLWNFGSERARFFEEAAVLEADADRRLGLVRTRVEQVAEKRDAPDNLEADAKRWRNQASKVHSMMEWAGALEAGPEGWVGGARDNYVTAVGVQKNALEELEGIMTSTANGCKLGASLNSAVFFVMKEAIEGAAGRIATAPGGTDGNYYARTAAASNECYQLWLDLLTATNGEVVGGTATNLSSEIVGALGAPNLLREGYWPTGTAAAGTQPAPTDTVPEDGNANLNPDGTESRGDSTGVEL